MRANRSSFTALVAGALILVGKITMAQTAAEEDLIDLAREHFRYESIPAEEKNAFDTFFQNAQNGERTDLTSKLEKNRIIEAAWLVWICTDSKASSKVTPKGIEIVGAQIEGQVTMADTKVPFPLQMSKCAFNESIVLDRSILRSLQLQGTHIRGLQGDGLTVEGEILLSDGFQALGPVFLKDATIGGALNCDNGQFINPDGQAHNLEGAKTGTIYLRNVRAEGLVWLFGATIAGNLECDNAKFINPGKPPDDQALNLEGAKIGAVYLRNGFRAEGGVRLLGAIITGDLECDNAKFINPGKPPDDQALNLEGAKIGAVYLRNGFRAEGGVRLFGATITGNLECDNAKFINPGGQALNLEGAKTGAVYLRNGFRAEGELWLRNVTVGGDLDCENGHFINRGKWAIIAELANIQGSVRLVNCFVADGSVSFQEARIANELILADALWHKDASLDLRAATVKTLLNEKKSWPEKANLLLDGFVFEELGADAASTAKDQVGWIHLQPNAPFRSQPYEQMAKVFRDMGLQEEAVKVLIAKKEDAGRYSQDPWNWFWYHVFGKFIKYGYRPWNALLVSVLIVAYGAFVFRLGYQSELITPTSDNAYRLGGRGKQRLKGTYPKFNALIYSVETFVPLLKLAVEQHWIPNANRGRLFCVGRLTVTRGGLLRCYFWFHIIAGWILTTLWLGGFTGLIKT